MLSGGLVLSVFLATVASVYGQRITTIQLDGVQYFVSRMNPYSPELNYFLAYQYCRSLGLQLASFESREKSDSLMQYLRNAGYNKFDYWTSGNRLGTDMLLWMSTGAPFNTTFDYMRKLPTNDVQNSESESDSVDPATTLPGSGVQQSRSRRPGRQSPDEISTGCVTLRAPSLEWDTDDCNAVKDFICEQTRCYYYNYGSIPVSTAQGDKKIKPTLAPLTSSTATEETSTETQTTPDKEITDNLQPSEETVHRHITLRPLTASKDESTQLFHLLSTTPHPTSVFNTMPKLGEADVVPRNNKDKFASRTFPVKDADSNVVYVTAIGVKDQDGGSATAYMDAGRMAVPLKTAEQSSLNKDEPKVAFQGSEAIVQGQTKVLDPPITDTFDQEETMY